MTYCVALKLEAGLVMLADTRTNAGVDNVSRFAKLFTWEVAGDRAICLMSAGNLSITQGVVTAIDTDIQRAAAGEEVETILNAPSMYRVAEIVGEQMTAMQGRYRDTMSAQGAGPDATILVAGQRRDGTHRLFMVYSAGNFIEATDDTPYFQIGEHKYGKPILDRVIRPDTALRHAIKAAFVSMDSTLRSNLSVGMPLDLVVIRTGGLCLERRMRIEEGDEHFQTISRLWSERLKEAFMSLPELEVDGPAARPVAVPAAADPGKAVG